MDRIKIQEAGKAVYLYYAARRENRPAVVDISYDEKVGSWLPGISNSGEGNEMLPDGDKADAFAGVEDDDDDALLLAPDLEEYQKVITQSAA